MCTSIQLAQYKYGFDKWNVWEEEPLLPGDGKENQKPIDSTPKNYEDNTKANEENRMILPGDPVETDTNIGNITIEQLPQPPINIDDNNDDITHDIVEFQYDFETNELAEIKTTSTVTTTQQKQVSMISDELSNDCDDFSKKKKSLLFDGKYFKLISNDDKGIHATCVTCKKPYRGQKNVTSNFVSHLKVFFSLSIF